MKVAVTGAAGRMGRLIVKKVVEDEQLELVQAFDVVQTGKDAGEVAGIGRIGVEIQSDIKKLDADILIDFTTAEAAVKNTQVAAERGVKLVVGTTGFNDSQKKELEENCRRVPSVVSPNFSIGVNVFWKIIEFAASYLHECDVEVVEIHHRKKKDSPSGTAIKAAEIVKNVLEARKRIVELKFCREGLSPRGEEIGVFGIRGGDVVGEHTVYFFGEGERIEIIHRALSRECFASGAILAAKWLAAVDQPGIYSMNDVLGF
jgi:4-hydroxy-tetrahydrodipicolinate reductase